MLKKIKNKKKIILINFYIEAYPSLCRPVQSRFLSVLSFLIYQFSPDDN
jgi:hypothetical protein